MSRRRSFQRFSGFLFSVVVASFSYPAAAETCNNGSYYGKYPMASSVRMQTSIIHLCNSRHSNGYSTLSRTGVWATEYLTAADVRKAQQQSRENKFHEDMRIPIKDRALLNDYRRSGFDRGHLYPNGDTPDRRSQEESFALSNMIPQNGENNRSTWSNIEKRTRNLVMKYNAAYIVTGAAFIGQRLQAIGSGVLVPTHVWKAVYVPSKERASAYIVENNATSEGRYVSVNELAPMTGIDPFPSLAERLKNDKFQW